MRPAVPLPDAAQVRREFQAMVDLGARLTGSPPHDAFCSWIVEELAAAGLQIGPTDLYDYDRFTAGDFGLEVLEGASPGPVDVATSLVRAVGTPLGGVTGPLLHADGFPQTSVLDAMLDPNAATAAVRTWVASVPDGAYRDAVLLIDLETPGALPADVFLMVAAHLQWDGHTPEDWSAVDYSRAWIGPWPDLDVLTPLGVAGVVFTTLASKEMLRGNNSSHIARPQPLPALVVDRATGADLRARAEHGATVRLWLDVEIEPVQLRQLTAVLPGTSDECIVVNTHTDGQNAFEENGAVAAVQLARHFASLPPGDRLDRALVFAFYPGHMSGRVGIEDPRGWILTHAELVERAVGAISIEHLGATEWVDDVRGFRPTGEIELYGIWTTQDRPTS